MTGVCLVHAAMLTMIWIQAPTANPIEISQPAIAGVIVAPANTSQPQPAKPKEPAKPQHTSTPQPKPKLQHKPTLPYKPKPKVNSEIKPLPRVENPIATPPKPIATPISTTTASTSAMPSAPEGKQADIPVQAPRVDASHLKNPAPQYPTLSRRLREQGRVLLELLILADGTIGEIRVKTSSGFARLDQAALSVVKHWRYVPANRRGEAIPFRYLQPIEFSLAN